MYLANNKKLNDFLVNGQLGIFIGFRQESIFKLPDFVKFISPYFAPKFDRALLIAFEKESIELTRSILNTSSLITQADINIAYHSVSSNIQNNIAVIDELTKDIKNEESAYDDDDIDELVELVKEYFPAEIINCLPQYFESQILKIAKSINFLQLSIWDAFDNTQVPKDLLEYLLTLNIRGLDKPTFENNYRIVKKKNDERIKQESYEPILRKYADFLIEAKSKMQEIINKTITPNSLQNWINSSLSISDINNLSTVFDEIKNQVALSLRVMSVDVWNSYSNIDISINLINKANSITGLKAETKDNLTDAKSQLLELKRKIDLNNLTRERATTPSVTRPITTKTAAPENNSGFLWIIGIIAVIAIIYAISNSNNSSSNNYIAPSSHSYTAPTNNDYQASTPSSNDNTSTNTYSQPVESKYKGNQLNNGASPLNGCFGKGYSGRNASLKIKNGGSSDAIICLYVLAAYKEYLVKSTYQENEKWNYRSFRFTTEKEIEPIDFKESEADEFKTVTEIKTCVNPNVLEKSALSIQQISEAIMKHCLIYYLNDALPIIEIIDNEDNTGEIINQLFEKVSKEKERDFPLHGHKFKIYITKTLKEGNRKNNYLFYCANSRTVGEGRNLKNVNTIFSYPVILNGNYYFFDIYLVSVFLNSKVYKTRNGFNIPKERENLLFKSADTITIQGIEEKVSEILETEYADFVKEAKEHNVQQVSNYIAQKAPRYNSFLRNPELLQSVPPNLTEDKLEEHLYRVSFTARKNVEQNIEKFIKNKTVNEEAINHIINDIKAKTAYDVDSLADYCM